MVWPAPPELPRYRYIGELTGEVNFERSKDTQTSFVAKALRWLVGIVSGKPVLEMLQRPQAGMVTSGRVLVTDVSRQAVAVFDEKEGTFSFWEDAAPGQRFLVPIALAEGPNKEIFVTDSKLGFVARLNESGEPLAPFGADELDHPTGIARDPERGWVYVADTHEHAIKIFNDEGVFLRSFGIKGDGEGNFNSPTHLDFKAGKLYVSDTLNARVQLFDRDGNFIKTFGRRGLFVGNMPRPKGITVDNNGLIYVVESFHDYLLIFSSEGEFLMPIGGSGRGIGQFYLPSGVWNDNNNKVYVADMFNGRVVVFEFLGEMGHGS